MAISSGDKQKTVQLKRLGQSGKRYCVSNGDDGVGRSILIKLNLSSALAVLKQVTSHLQRPFFRRKILTAELVPFLFLFRCFPCQLFASFFISVSAVSVSLHLFSPGSLSFEFYSFQS